MESNFEIINNNKNTDLIHYSKINIFGDSFVGKSSLISLMENFSNNDFKIQIENENNENRFSLVLKPSLVEQIKRIKIVLNEEDGIYLTLSLYETNLDIYNTIKLNLDALLLQTECIIIMFDSDRSETFDNIPNFISTIKEKIKDNNIKEVPIFLIQNKMDLKADNTRESIIDRNESIQNLIEENKDIIYKEISLLDKEDLYKLILDIQRNINKQKENFKDSAYSVKVQKYPNEIEGFELIENYITIKCILLGKIYVGKTTFFNYFNNLNKNQENNIIPISTNGTDYLTFLVEYKNRKFLVKLYDTAGQEKHNCIARNLFRDADGIFLFFDVTNRESFDEIDKHINHIKDIIGEEGSEIILIANKIDCEERVISKKEAKEKAESYNINYYECCCVNGLNLHEIFNEMIVLAFNKYFQKNPNGIKKSKTFFINKKEHRKNKKKEKCHCNKDFSKIKISKCLPHLKKK